MNIDPLLDWYGLAPKDYPPLVIPNHHKDQHDQGTPVGIPEPSASLLTFIGITALLLKRYRTSSTTQHRT